MLRFESQFFSKWTLNFWFSVLLFNTVKGLWRDIQVIKCAEYIVRVTVSMLVELLM